MRTKIDCLCRSPKKLVFIGISLVGKIAHLPGRTQNTDKTISLILKLNRVSAHLGMISNLVGRKLG